MKNYKKVIFVLVLTTIFTISAIAMAIFGCTTSLEEIESEISDKQSQAETIDSKIESVKNQKTSTEKTAAENEAELERIRDELAKELTEKEKAIEYLNNLKETLTEIDNTIAETQEKYDKCVSEFLERARLMYRYSDYSTMEIILESENLLDFFSRANMYTHMLAYDKELIEEIVILKEDLEAKKEYQTALAGDSEEILREIENDIAYLESCEDETLSEYNSNLSKIESLANQVAKLEEDDAKITAQIQELMAESKQYKYEGGKMLWPVASYVRISDTFGYRAKHPVTGLPSFHAGIDISAYEGTAIYAAAGGKVIVSAYDSTAGNYVIIDHGGGVCTVYCHASKLLVSVGQSVKRGDTIALVGTTGSSTGDHLHFEVRVDNTAVDPLDYLDVPAKG